jgi:general secretion pathway protein C
VGCVVTGFLKYILLVCLFLTAGVAVAKDNFLVLGIIHSKTSSESVALIKDRNSAKTFATREGMQLGREVSVLKITSKSVHVKTSAGTIVLGVGGDSATTYGKVKIANTSPEIEIKGETIKISESYRDHIVKNDLAKVLMQAAAVPQFNGEQLNGFKLWDIEPGSIYEQVGFKNGDVVTAIDGQELSDVGSTIKLLQALKNESNTSVTLKRSGQTLEMKIQVQ